MPIAARGPAARYAGSIMPRLPSFSILLIATIPSALFATGETVNGFPTWEERVLQQLINRARVAPNTDLAACGANCTGEYPSCYTAVAPLPWTYGLNRSSRFHSASMAKNAFFDHPTPFVVRNDIDSVYPGSCDGSASCASSGSGSTDPFVRISLFGVSGTGEIIAAGYGTPYDAFYGWLYENGNSTGCTFSMYNGHRYLMLTGGPGLGLGYVYQPGSPWTSYYTGDFGTGSSAGKIVSGTHWGAAGSTAPNQRQSSSIEFWANWYDTSGPLVATVVVDDVSNVMSLGRGTSANGAWTTTLGGLGSGCHRYYFQFTDSGGHAVRYPTTGTLGVGDSSCSDWTGGITMSGDFNADGKNDLVLRNYSTGQNAIWIMNGTSLTTIADLPALPNTSYRFEGTADFSGDSKPDIVLRNMSTGQDALWIMNGTSLSSIVDLPALPNTNYHFQATGDFNKDGKPDIVLRNMSTGQDALWIMNGTSLSTIVDLPALPNTNYQFAGAADFNGDGNVDIVLRNDSTGQNALWLMNGTSLTTIVDLPALPNTNYRIDAVGDFNGDGKPDIVWRNYATGQNAVWIMNGTSLSSIVDLPALPNLNYQFAGPR